MELYDFLYSHVDEAVQITRNGKEIVSCAVKFVPFWVVFVYGENEITIDKEEHNGKFKNRVLYHVSIKDNVWA